MSSIKSTLSDIYECFQYRHIWIILSSWDIKTRYRRTVIGPFWLTLGTSVTILGLGIVSSSIFNVKIQEFLPYIAVGIVIWTYISTIISEGCTVFTSQMAIIHNVKMSYFLYIMTMISRNIIILFHNMFVILAVFIVCGQQINYEILWFIPGFILLILNSFWVSVVLGIFATRYRDLASIVGSIIMLTMFVTPIMWKPDMLAGNRKIIATLNPFAHMISLVRDPLLGQAPSLESYLVIGGIFVLGFLSSLWMYRKYINRVVFWM